MSDDTPCEKWSFRSTMLVPGGRLPTQSAWPDCFGVRRGAPGTTAFEIAGGRDGGGEISSLCQQHAPIQPSQKGDRLDGPTRTTIGRLHRGRPIDNRHGLFMRRSRLGTIPTSTAIRPQTSRLFSILAGMDETLRTQICRVRPCQHRIRSGHIPRRVPCWLAKHGNRMGRRRRLHVRRRETGVRRLVRIILRIHGVEHARLWHGSVRGGHLVWHLQRMKIRLRGFERRRLLLLEPPRQGGPHITHVHC